MCSEKLFSEFHWGFFMAWHMIYLYKYSCAPEKCVYSHYYPCLSIRWSSFFVLLDSSKIADFVSDQSIIKEYMVKWWWIFPSLCEVLLSFASYLVRHFHQMLTHLEWLDFLGEVKLPSLCTALSFPNYSLGHKVYFVWYYKLLKKEVRTITPKSGSLVPVLFSFVLSTW